MKMNRAVSFCLCAVLVLGWATLGLGKDRKIVKQTRVPFEAVGEVTWIGYDSIAIIPQENLGTVSEDEIHFTFKRKKVALEHLKNLSEIGKGDTVRIKFSEESIQYEGEPEVSTLKVQSIGFVRKGTPRAIPAPQEETGMEVLGSEEQ